MARPARGRHTNRRRRHAAAAGRGRRPERVRVGEADRIAGRPETVPGAGGPHRWTAAPEPDGRLVERSRRSRHADRDAYDVVVRRSARERCRRSHLVASQAPGWSARRHCTAYDVACGTAATSRQSPSAVAAARAAPHRGVASTSTSTTFDSVASAARIRPLRGLVSELHAGASRGDRCRSPRESRHSSSADQHPRLPAVTSRCQTSRLPGAGRADPRESDPTVLDRRREDRGDAGTERHRGQRAGAAPCRCPARARLSATAAAIRTSPCAFGWLSSKVSSIESCSRRRCRPGPPGSPRSPARRPPRQAARSARGRRLNQVWVISESTMSTPGSADRALVTKFSMLFSTSDGV